MSSADDTRRRGMSVQDAFTLAGSLGAVVTVVASVMLYFGWRRSDVQAREMGIDVTLFGFSTQDYLLRSISSLYLPMLVVFGAVLAWLWLHGKVTVMLRRTAAGRRDARDRLAVTYRRVALAATVIAIGCVGFTAATGLSSPPWPVDPIADVLVDHQWTVPCALVVATLTATYAWWIHRRLTDRTGADLGPWHTALTGVIVAATVLLGGFWMLEEYASAVGKRYASQVAASVDDLTRATVISPAPLGIRAVGVDEERVQESESVYYRTTGLRLLARSGGNVLLLPSGWTLEDGVVIVIADRDDLIWQFSR